MDFLSQIYIASTVFSVGVTLLDLMGLIGRSDHDGDSSHADSDTDGHGADFAADSLAGPTSREVHGDTNSETLVEHTNNSMAHSGGTSILSMLAYLRSLVYFCLGFGPMGLFSVATDVSGIKSLLWSVPTGVGATIFARLFFRFQRSEIDSSLKPQEILFQEATVIVPITHSRMGRIRIQLGMNITERFALAKVPDETFAKNEVVWITEVTDEHVFVERNLIEETD